MGRRFTVRAWVVGIVLLGVLFALLGGISVATWEYTNSDAFCANGCHDVHPEEVYAHHISQHSEVACVECHMGRLGTFEAMAKKVTHVGELWAMLAGYERPITASMPASRKSCEGCHSKLPHQHNSIRVRTYFTPDKDNTKKKIALIMRTAGRPAREQGGQGIHWHTQTQVRFIATDPQQQQIPWVEVTKADGSTEVFTDRTQRLSEAQVAQADKTVMECIHCHNRSGHPFENPEEIVDQGMAQGKLSDRLPYVKARVVALLKQGFETREQALEQVKAAWRQYEKDFPDVPKAYPEAWAESRKFMRERQEFAADLLVRSKFLDPGVSWRSFPDNMGHKYAPGCFRCHSGRHRDPEGKPIPTHCTLCHSVPVIIRDDYIPSSVLATLNLVPPPSHHSPDFVANHRSMIDETCQGCHGEIRYGTDDKTFCSNSGCHGEKWPGLTLTPG